MDVRLLSGMIGDLMLGTDSLSLPGLGTFVAEEMPASFSDRGYSVNPPYRRLSFTSRQTEDNQLAALYASSNEGLSAEDAASIISSFCDSLKDELNSTKSVDFPGLGRLRATREGLLFFVADPDLDISPDACGLGAVSLKTHSLSAAELPEGISALATGLESAKTQIQDQKLSESIPEPAKTQIQDQKLAESIPEPAKTQIQDQKLAESIPEPEFADQAGNDATVAPKSADAAEEDSVRGPLALTKRAPDAVLRSEEAEKKPRRRMSKGLRWTIALGATAVALLIAFVVVSRLAPDFTDRLLYTPEQLEILNTPLEDGTGIPG